MTGRVGDLRPASRKPACRKAEIVARIHRRHARPGDRIDHGYPGGVVIGHRIEVQAVPDLDVHQREDRECDPPSTDDPGDRPVANRSFRPWVFSGGIRAAGADRNGPPGKGTSDQGRKGDIGRRVSVDQEQADRDDSNGGYDRDDVANRRQAAPEVEQVQRPSQDVSGEDEHQREDRKPQERARHVLVRKVGHDLSFALPALMGLFRTCAGRAGRRLPAGHPSPAGRPDRALPAHPRARGAAEAED